MRIPTGNFGQRTPSPATSGVRIPQGRSPGAALADLGDTVVRIGATELRDQQQELRKQEERADASAAAAAFASYEVDSTADLQSVLTDLEEGKIQRDQAQGALQSRLVKRQGDHLKSIKPEYKQALQDNLIRFDGSATRTLDGAILKHARRERVGNFSTMVENLERLAVQDPNAAIEQAASAYRNEGIALFGADQAVTQLQTFTERAYARHFSERMLASSQDPNALKQLETQISKNEDLNPDRKLQLLNNVKSAQQQAYASTASDLEIAVRRGQAGYRDIEQALKGGMITPAKRTELTTWLDSERKRAGEKQLQERAAMGKVAGAVAGQGYLDFRSDKDRDAVDLYYNRVLLPSITRNKLDPQQGLQEVIAFSARTGIIPGPLKQVIRGALRAGDSQDKNPALGMLSGMGKAQAADILDRLKDANPQVLNDFTDEDIALGNSIQTYVKAGVAPLQAVALAEKNLTVPDAEREARKTRYAADKAPTKNLKHLEKEITGFRWTSANIPAKVPDALAGEYEKLVREEFTRSGELEAAQSTAMDHLRRVWGVTNVDSKPRWMKYAPETIFKVPGEDGSWIREQLYADVTKGALFDGKPDLTLAADSLTARSDTPSYVVLRRNAGVLEPLLGADGRPLRFRPDYASSPAGARRQKAAEDVRTRAVEILSPEPAVLPNEDFTATTGGAATARKKRKP